MPKNYHGRTHAEWEAHSRDTIKKLYDHVMRETAEACRVDDNNIYRPASLGIMIKLASYLCGFAVSEATSIAELQTIQHNVQEAITQNCDRGVSAFFEAHPQAALELAKMMTSTEGNA
jgi:DNA topoisomerase VI subunit B